MCKTLHNPIANVKMAVWNNLSAERYVREKENTGVKKNCAKRISISLKTLVHDKNAVCTLRGKLRFFALCTPAAPSQHRVRASRRPQAGPGASPAKKWPKSAQKFEKSRLP